MLTIFVARENVLFLKEWLNYHANLGVERFLLYDNSKSIGRQGSTATTNKYGIEFAKTSEHLSDHEVETLLREAMANCSARCTLLRWEPTDRKGRVVYQPKKAVVDCARRFGADCDWLGVFDIDEFLFSPRGDSLESVLDSHSSYQGVTVRQKKFEDRFLHLGQRVTSITRCVAGLNTWRLGPKMFVRPGIVSERSVTSIHTLARGHKVARVNPSRLRFNHYNGNPKSLANIRRFFNDPALEFDEEDQSLASRVQRSRPQVKP